MKTMVSAFDTAVDYQKYRLRIRSKEMKVDESTGIYHVKQQVVGLHPNLEVFDGRIPIGLLSWLTTLCDTSDILETSEESAVHLFAYFLGGEANDVHVEHFGKVEFDFFLLISQ